MNVRKILSVCKNKINFYSYLYLGVTLMSGRMSFNKYKRLKADLMRAGGLQLGPVDSVSCLHALEHFGLGRYGDPICYDGYFIGFKNITNLLDTGGRFYFSVPMGEQRIEFHAHRVFSLKFLLEMITPFFDIRTFSYVDDSNSFHKEVKLTQELIEANCGCHFGCAIFDLIKK